MSLVFRGWFFSCRCDEVFEEKENNLSSYTVYFGSIHKEISKLEPENYCQLYRRLILSKKNLSSIMKPLKLLSISLIISKIASQAAWLCRKSEAPTFVSDSFNQSPLKMNSMRSKAILNYFCFKAHRQHSEISLIRSPETGQLFVT